MGTDADDTPGSFSAAEKDAMRARAEEIRAEKAQGRGAKKRENDRTKLEELIAGLPEGGRRDAHRVHEIVSLVAPQLDPRTWYGMPAWALDGEVICFFTPASKFDERRNGVGPHPPGQGRCGPDAGAGDGNRTRVISLED